MAYEITVSDLPHFHTKILLKALRRSCIDDEQLSVLTQLAHDTNAPEPPPPKDVMYESGYVYASSLGFDDSMGCSVTVADLKRELATRPHVPNKQEAKAIRKAKALAGKNKGRRDR